MNTRFQDLNLSNYFLFAAAAEDEETSQLLIETLLGSSPKLGDRH